MQTPALPLATALQLLLKSRQVSQELTWAVLACSQGLPGLTAGPGSSTAQGALGECPVLGGRGEDRPEAQTGAELRAWGWRLSGCPDMDQGCSELHRARWEPPGAALCSVPPSPELWRVAIPQFASPWFNWDVIWR